MEKQTTKISLPPRAVVGITLRQQAKALKAPRGVDVSPLLVTRSFAAKDEGRMTKDEGLSQRVESRTGSEQAGSLFHEMEARLARLEAEIAELRAERVLFMAAIQQRTGIYLELPGIWHCTKILMQEHSEKRRAA